MPRLLPFDRVGKKDEPELVHHDFVYPDDRALDAMIAAFRSDHEQTHGQRLAMHVRRELGRGKVRISFRVVEPAKRRS